MNIRIWSVREAPLYVWIFAGLVALVILILYSRAVEATLWQWLRLLVVPAAIALVGTVGGAWFTKQRARDTALQAYLDKMSELLIDKRLRQETHRYGDTRITARARTLAVLTQLDGDRKRIVLQFLREARLINKDQHNLGNLTVYPRIVGLRNADLSNANLRKMKLISTSREEAVSLEGAFLEYADLRSADLERADLSGAVLRGADLREAILKGANLSNADLRGADLRKARLEGANLYKANLRVFDPESVVPRRICTDLRGAQGLTQPRLEETLRDNTTKLPRRQARHDSSFSR